MADLIAQGRDSQDRWRRSLPDGETVILGRTADTWAVPWDDQISRRHAAVRWRNGRLQVHRLPTARHPLFVRGQTLDDFELQPRECFVAGQTTFTVADDHVSIAAQTDAPFEERS